MATKRRRLQELAGIGGVSDSALSTTLARLRANPISEPVSRLDVNRACSDSVANLLGFVDLPLASGGMFKWPLLRPDLLLQHTVRSSPAFARAFTEALRTCPSTSENPWSLMVFFDELTPGNVLRPDNRRKIMSVYFSFKELGPHVLCKTEAWLTVTVVRTTMISEVVGGWSHMLRVLLRHMLLGPQSWSSGGVVLQLPNPVLFFAVLKNIIGDEAALKQAYDNKGASGLRPCPLCKNVVMKGSDLVPHDRSGYLVEITCPSLDRFDVATDEDA